MHHADTWHMTNEQQWTSLAVVVVIVALVVMGAVAVWSDYRKSQSIQQWTDEFIPDSSEVREVETIRSRMQALRERRSA